MIAVGLDIGTTTICGIAIDGDTGALLHSITLRNAFLPGAKEWEKIQDPNAILQTVLKILAEMTAKFSVACIGITGQMHGIVYADANGDAVSPLYIWQDGRGGEIAPDGRSYAEIIGAKAGYGCATHYYNTDHHLVPVTAAHFCTIADFVGMKLTGNTAPVTDLTDGASLGLFDLEKRAFDLSLAKSLGMNPDLFPEVKESTFVVGKTKDGIPVINAIGDNQASFVGSVKDMEQSVLINIGTGSQASLFVPHFAQSPALETRPCMENGYLMVGASLCGGRAYAILKNFYFEVMAMMGFPDSDDLYDRMQETVCNMAGEPALRVETTFSGTRLEPSKKGGIFNLDEAHFHPADLTYGVICGIVTELLEMTKSVGDIVSERTLLIGSGNGIRKNAAMQRVLTERFKMRLFIPAHNEEAAYGAALNGLVGIGAFSSITEAQQLIQYQ